MTVRTVVADRDPDQRHLLRLALARDPAFSVVAEAGDGAEAFAAAVDCEADLLLLDVDLAHLDGLEVILRVRAARPECACILVSSIPSDQLRLPGAHGAVGLVARSTPATKLADEIRAVAAAVDVAVEAAGAIRIGPDKFAPRAARRFVDEVLADGGYGDVLDVVELLVTEVVTNAVMHARSEADVVLRLLPDAVRVEVRDDDDSFPIRREPHPDRPGGRGFDLVERLSRSWGIDMLDVGKRVWFEVATS